MVSFKLGDVIKLNRFTSVEKMNIHYKVIKIETTHFQVEVVANPTLSRPIGWCKNFYYGNIDYYNMTVLYSGKATNFKRGRYGFLSSFK